MSNNNTTSIICETPYSYTNTKGKAQFLATNHTHPDKEQGRALVFVELNKGAAAYASDISVRADVSGLISGLFRKEGENFIDAADSDDRSFEMLQATRNTFFCWVVYDYTPHSEGSHPSLTAAERNPSLTGR